MAVSKKKQLKDDKHIKPKHTKLPMFMYPQLIHTASDRLGFYEEGGLIFGGTPLKGFAKVLCSHGGKAKKPIYIFHKHSFTEPYRNHTKSLLFYTVPGDYVISVACRGITHSVPGLITVAIFKNIKQKQKKNERPNKNPPECHLTLVTSFVVSLPENSDQGKEMLSLYQNTKMGITPFLTKRIQHRLELLDLCCLMNPILAALEKMGNIETSYSYCHNAHIIKKMENLFNTGSKLENGDTDL